MGIGKRWSEKNEAPSGRSLRELEDAWIALRLNQHRFKIPGDLTVAWAVLSDVLEEAVGEERNLMAYID